nr:immunoglobulin light chain junction region [Macaca mulatta]MOX48905.1 immunoglobulin light chain junction region [Macaca mulatta]
CLQGSYWPLTF